MIIVFRKITGGGGGNVQNLGENGKMLDLKYWRLLKIKNEVDN